MPTKSLRQRSHAVGNIQPSNFNVNRTSPTITQRLGRNFKSLYLKVLKVTSQQYLLEDEFRSPIKERNDFELEFIVDVFAKKHFDPSKYLIGEYNRVKSIARTEKIIDKLNKCVLKTSVSLTEMVKDNYLDFISCFSQIHDIEAFFMKTGTNIYIEKVLHKFATILRYQDEIVFDLDHSKWQELFEKTNLFEKHIYDDNNVQVIPGNDIVDSPSSLLDDIGTMCDERKWPEATFVLNMITQDIQRGEYNYLKPKTRKQIKQKIIKFRKIIYSELAKLLTMNALNKSYRRRVTVYILKIRRSRYFNRGIKLYLECKLKELTHNISAIEMRSDLKAYVTDLTILVFHSIRELITEFSEILIESANIDHKDAFSYLIVYILKDVLVEYVEQLKSQVFEATKCDISLKLIGECLRISFGHLNKLKWHGLCLEMYLNHYLFEMVRDTIDLYFADEINEILYCLLHDSFDIKQISLLATTLHNRKSAPEIRTLRKVPSFYKYETVAMSLSACMSTEESTKHNDDHNDKAIIYITSSTQMVYKYIRKCLTESRSLLSFSYYPIMTKQLLSRFIENIIKYVQSYCSKITQILKQSNMSSETKCIAMMCNVYYIANDLLVRTNDRLLTQTRFKKMERIEVFQSKLIILYKEQFKYFARTISIKWIRTILQFKDGCIPSYYRMIGNGDDIIEPSQSWIQLMKNISMTYGLCNDYFQQKNAVKIAKRIITNIIRHLNHDRYWVSVTIRSSVSLQKHDSLAMDIPAENEIKQRMSHHGLQQFIFDIKFFGVVTSGYLDHDSKVMVQSTIINQAITLYCDTNNNSEQITPGVVMKSNEYYQTNINKFLLLFPHLNFATQLLS